MTHPPLVIKIKLYVEICSALFLDTANTKPVRAIAVVGWTHATTVEAQVATGTAIARRRTPRATVTANEAHAAIAGITIASSREPVAIIGTSLIAGIPGEC